MRPLERGERDRVVSPLRLRLEAPKRLQEGAVARLLGVQGARPSPRNPRVVGSQAGEDVAQRAERLLVIELELDALPPELASPDRDDGLELREVREEDGHVGHVVHARGRSERAAGV